MLNGAAIAEAFGFKSTRRFYTELALLAAIAIAAAAWGVHLFAQFEFLRLCHGFDLWFDSDPARTVANITSRWAMFHDRSGLHPLYSIWIAAPFGALREIFHVPTSVIAVLYVGLQSALLSVLSFVALRAFGLPRIDAILGVLLLNATAAAIYWIGFPEWVTFGAATTVVSIMWIAAPATLRNRATGTAQNLISGSMVTTNWPLGAAASLISDWPKLNWTQAFQHTRDALALMAVFTVLQYAIFPGAGGFLDIWIEIGVFLKPHADDVSRSVLDHVVEFFGQTLVAPNTAVIEGPRTDQGWGDLIISSQHQAVALNPLTLSIFALWIALWALGVAAALRDGAVRRPVFVFVLGVVAFFFVLHAVLGGEIFLFSLQAAPALCFIALWGALGRYKLIARGLCVVLIAASFAYNYPKFQSAVAFHNAVDLSWLARDFPAQDKALENDCR